MPLHAALEHAALRTGPFTLDEPPAPADAARPTRPALVSARRRSRSRGRGLGQSILLIALAAAALMLLLTSTDALGATLVTPKCNDINLRTGPATTYARKTQVDTGARLTMVAKVDGGSYSAQCGGAQSGHYWYRISAINGKTVKSLYGVTYLYGAHKLFATVVSATPAPTQAVAPVPTAARPPPRRPRLRRYRRRHPARHPRRRRPRRPRRRQPRRPPGP